MRLADKRPVEDLFFGRRMWPTGLRLSITAESGFAMRGLQPVHSSEIPRQEFLKPKGLTKQ